MKTPLAVLTATAGRLRVEGDTGNAEVLELLSEEMAERIDYQLRLAQLRMRSAEHVLTASLDQVLLRSVTGDAQGRAGARAVLEARCRPRPASTWTPTI